MSSDLEVTRTAIAHLNTGKNANEDSWMTMWCNTNWGDLLQPAPLSIALLGSIMIISASTDDFSLINPDDPIPYEWKHTDTPGSFKASLMQMVNKGYEAFGTAHKSMTRIQNASSQLPGIIKTSVYTIIRGKPDEVRAYLPDQIQSALDLANICAAAAKESEDAFHGIQDLAGELVVASTNRVGSAQQKLQANQTQLAILEERKKSEADRVKVAKETNERMKKSFDNAEEDFHTAVKNVPTGWEIVGMQTVESLTQLVVSAGNAAISVATLRQQAAMAGIGMLQKVTGSDPKDTENSGNQPGNSGNQPGNTSDTSPPSVSPKTQPTAATINDPAVLEVSKVLQLANALQLLVAGGPNGGPDWDKIRGTGANGSQTGGLYVQISLSTIKDRLVSSTGKPVSAELLPVVESGITIAKGIVAVSNSVQGEDDESLDKYKPQITTLISDAQQLVTKANLILQQPGTVGTGPATPPTPAQTSSSAAKLAVENAKFQVDQTRANLQASRDAYNTATEKLLEQQEQISKTIAQLTSLSLTNAGLKAMLPVLKKAVGAFTTLQAQFSQISEFFDNVASLLGDILKPSVDGWAKTMENTATLGGVTVGGLARHLIYTQMMLPLKVSMLSEKIATVYLEVSENYIMPAQRSVGGMMEFSADDTEEGRAKLMASLEKKQTQLQKQSDEASKRISSLVAADQKKFMSAINERLDGIQSALENVLPAVTQPVPKQIQDVTNLHETEYKEKREIAAKENPMFNDEELM